ncbi:hypothetical protein C9397_05010 [Xanthomonas vasicola pv. vasculorum]|uniref:Uncharacterized protein n=1 Tax=Xanthomonas vasicola pv. vasculorum TaxID=325776 RepID=A0AAE8F7F6_XANVA|nr:hypothetical protein C7V42_15295 [Xanthomonas vasicola pv. vasculorum]TWQ08629.1 hypothetical protein FQK02_07230 [Xanthomonas vasicola]AZM71968.1 hypothetical protein CXP37_15310 [Xanthomonas vasicola pv. vasculorum]PUE71056.1 hypothetical protein C7Y63_05080 [Xanthomonas vasicola pv. vasculorum]PUE75090.1 hypothetical protein C7Y61_05055 [Xanthomonas vasicola pv. vasculorum]
MPPRFDRSQFSFQLRPISGQNFASPQRFSFGESRFTLFVRSWQPSVEGGLLEVPALTSSWP